MPTIVFYLCSFQRTQEPFPGIFENEHALPLGHGCCFLLQLFHRLRYNPIHGVGAGRTILSAIKVDLTPNEVHVVPCEAILFRQPHTCPERNSQLAVMLREAVGDNGSYVRLFGVRQKSNATVILMLLANEPRRIARHFAVA